MLLACKDKSRGVQQIDVPYRGEVFTVLIEATVKANDNFTLYYTTDGTIKFNSKQAIWVSVKGQAHAQQIQFKLPKSVLPSQLRIDLGNNDVQPTINLNWIKLSYRSREVVIPGMLVFSYFRPDIQSTDFDIATVQIQGKLLNGDRLTPSLYPKEAPLAKQIKFLEGR